MAHDRKLIIYEFLCLLFSGLLSTYRVQDDRYPKFRQNQNLPGINKKLILGAYQPLPQTTRLVLINKFYLD